MNLLNELLRRLVALRRLLIVRLIIDVCRDSLGKDITPDDLVPDVVACAITVSTIINRVVPTFPKVSGTWTLYDVLEHRTDFKRTTIPTEGTIVLSPTGMGKKGTNGHVGIYDGSKWIMSNSSRTGTFEANYTLESWAARYHDQLGYPVLFYDRI